MSWTRKVPAGALLAAVAMTGAMACRTAMRNPSASTKTLGALRVRLPPSLAGERDAVAREVGDVMEEVADFFRSSGYVMASEGLIRNVVILDWSAATRQELAGIWGVRPDDIPGTFSGTVEGDTLYLVTRDRYREIWGELYPSWPWTGKTYHQLIVHELAHKAHELIAISRTGSPDGMGPTWFFEGLAVVCAGQFDGREPPMSPEEIEELVGGGRTPQVSYPLYGRLVRSLAASYGLKVLIGTASEPGFPDTLPGKR